MPLKYFARTGTSVELKDTTRLQKNSLDLFALAIEYQPFHGNYYKHGYIFEPTSKNIISLNTMQNWHNGNFSEYGIYSWHGESIIDAAAEKIGVKPAQLELAVKNKVLHTTHLQWSKKRKELVCTDHQISLI